MTTFLNRFATPLTFGLFAVSAVSGVALFFHWLPNAFHAMHEWLSVVLLVPFMLHVWKNWTPLMGYIRRGWMVLPLAASLVAAAFFVRPAIPGLRGGEPGARVVHVMAQSRLVDLAPLLKTTPEALAGTLRAQGYRVGTTSDTIDDVAARSNAPAMRVLMSALPAD